MAIVDANTRKRPPRSPDNPMAILAREILVDAERTFKKADALAAAMEPYVDRLYSGSAIYSYTNERAVPPGDVLLAAALAAGISVDQRLGIGQEPTAVERQVAELRSQMESLRVQVSDLQERLSDSATEGAEQASSRSDRNAQRREWARRSAATGSPEASPPARRPPGRQRGM